MTAQDLPSFIDSAWDRRTVDLSPSGERTIFVQSFLGLDQAAAFKDPHERSVHDAGHALFIGLSTPLPRYTDEEIKEFLASGDWPAQEPCYTDLVFVPSVSFEDLLGFLDLHNFAEFVRNTTKVRAAAKEQLREVYAIEPFLFTTINNFGVAGTFLRRLPLDRFNVLFEMIYDFSCKYFSHELARETWRRTYRKHNSFGIGPQ